MLWLAQSASGDPGERVTVLVANRGFDDASYPHAVVVLQQGERQEIGVIINRPTTHARYRMCRADPGELAEELKRGLWLKQGLKP